MKPALAMLAWLAVACMAGAAEPYQTALWSAGQDGYHTYRIPSIIVTPKSNLLAFCEARKKGRGDAGNIDLVWKRSTDGGQTWSRQAVLWDDGLNTCGNPCPVVDRSTGTIWLLLTHNLGTDTEKMLVEGKSQGTRSVWVTKSTDDGVTWDRPLDITKSVKRPDWTWYATGPGIGIQTKSGRLVVPCDNKVAKSIAHQSHVIFSDDHGQTWQIGGVVGPEPACNESQIVELSDTSLLLNMRSYRGNNRRLVARSTDDGLSFSKPVPDAALIEPVCQGSVIRAAPDKPWVLFSNPASTKREKLTVRLSVDDAKSWQFSRLIHDGPAAYSCLAVLPGGDVVCLYERGTKDPYESITLARFSLDWLKQKP